MSCPRHDRWFMNARLVERSFASAKAAGGIEEIDVVASENGEHGPVVGGEDEDGPLFESGIAHGLYQHANMFVQPRDHRCISRPRRAVRNVIAQVRRLGE